MELNLALKYRPHRFEDVVGQRATTTILAAMIAKNSLAQVLLFTGDSGVGKTTMARIIAAQLNSEAAQDVRQGTHPSVLEIDGASNGSVAAIRDLKKDLNFAVLGNRVIIIDEVHSISSSAFDALKEMLEFPPANVYFILCTTEAHKLEPAIRHRCDRYNFKKASVEDLRDRLNYVVDQESIDIDSAMIELIAQRSEGSYREALMLLQQVWKGDIHNIEEYNELQGEVDYGPSLIASALGGPSSAIVKLESILRHTNTEEVADRAVETIKDVILLKSGIALSYSGKALDDRVQLMKVDISLLVKIIKILWDLQTKLGAGDPVRGLEMAFTLIGEILKAPDKVEPSTNRLPVGNAPMSLSAMKNFRG